MRVGSEAIGPLRYSKISADFRRDHADEQKVHKKKKGKEKHMEDETKREMQGHSSIHSFCTALMRMGFTFAVFGLCVYVRAHVFPGHVPGFESAVEYKGPVSRSHPHHLVSGREVCW